MQAGLSELRAPFEIGRCGASFHAVLYTLEGTASVETPQAETVLRAGDLWIGSAGHSYRYRAGARWKVLWFHLADIAHWAALRAWPIGVRPSLGLRSLCQATEEFLAETIHPRGDASQVARAYAKIIGLYLNRIGRESVPPSQAREVYELNLFWEAVDAELSFDWTVPAMASRLHLSATHFHRLVARHYHASPMQMVTRLRMRRAQEMLRGGDDTIEHIALSTGYSNSASFSKAFARHFGQSPGRFRASTGRATS